MVLKVQCDACAARYKLDESRIKGKGARITCPKCGHQFVVYKRDLPLPPEIDDDDDEPATIIANRDSLFPPGTLDGAMPQRSPAPVAAVPSGPVVNRPTSAVALNWREVGLTSFKVKVSFGLVYDFSDVTTLKKYIADKKVQNSDSVSMDGKTWLLLGEIGDLDTWFIDRWVALKKAKLIEEGGSAAEVDVSIDDEPDDFDAATLAPPAAKAPKVQPAPQPPRSKSQSVTPVSAAETAGLADDLFGDIVEEDSVAPHVPHALRAQLRTPSGLADPRGGGELMQPPARRGPLMSGAEAGVLVLLTLVAVGLAGLWSSGAAAGVSPQSFDVASDRLQLQERTNVLFPSLGRDLGKQEIVPEPVPGPVPPRPEPQEAAVVKEPEPEASASKGTKPRKQDSAGVKVSSISAGDLVELGDALLASGDNKGAAEAYARAAGMAPGNGAYQVKLGRAYAAANATGKAEQALNQGLKLNPKLVDAHKYLGEVYEKTGRKSDAAAAYRRYLDGKPGAADRAEIEARISRLG